MLFKYSIALGGSGGVRRGGARTSILSRRYKCWTLTSARVIDSIERTGFHVTGARNATHAIATPSAALLRATLVHATLPLDVARPTPNYDVGFGRLQLDVALPLLARVGASSPALRLWLRDNAPIAPLASHHYCFRTAVT